MDDILHRLFKGELSPAAEIRSADPNYTALWREFEAARDAFGASLDEKGRAQFDALDRLYTEESFAREEAAFTHGLRFGIQLMRELL